MGVRLYQGCTFIDLKKSPGGTIIPGGTFIRESRVCIIQFVIVESRLQHFCSVVVDLCGVCH